ncbi:MAG TPA: PIN domain-containing protein [Herpetosiphonaceae bacterium]|nr:PIN domain-containing protein [Herpetosiphonaceae bacterium]
MSVVDASVLVAIFYPPDVSHKASRQWLEHYVFARGSLTLPRLALAEVAGAIARNANDTPG